MKPQSQQLAADLGGARGALAEQQALIRLRHLARHLKRWKGRNRSRQLGSHASPFRGRGLSFHHVREYQAGDEIRHIDWRVTARTSSAHTKVFEEETERPVLLFLDQRQNMFFGSRRCFKSVLACHVMALLAWVGLESNDRVGGLVFSDQGHQEVRPRRNHRAALQLIHNAVTYNHALAEARPSAASPEQSLATALEELRRINRPGSTIFLISDFHGLSTESIRQLHLLSRHSDLFALPISDPMERQLPGKGHYSVSNGEQRLQLDVNARLQQRFARESEEQQAALARQFRHLGIRAIRLDTDRDFFPILQRELALA